MQSIYVEAVGLHDQFSPVRIAGKLQVLFGRRAFGFVPPRNEENRDMMQFGVVEQRENGRAVSV